MSGAGIEVTGLTVVNLLDQPVVDHLNFTLPQGSLLGLVGESGSGKTTLALAMMGYTQPGLRLADGKVQVGNVVVPRDEREARRIRGRVISYVPQDPGNSLNPALSIATSVKHVIDTQRANAGATQAAIDRALTSVGLPAGAQFSSRYPHQLSGGQQQRVCIAMALSGQPPFVVLDEPTTGLDVVTQATVLAEVARLRAELGTTMVYVSHDLAVVSEIADHVAVMYAGRIIEMGPAQQVLTRPRHPYTRGLIAAIPDYQRPQRLRGLPGVAVAVGDRPAGCSYSPRCPLATDRCRSQSPAQATVGDGHWVSCWEWGSPLPQAAEAAVTPPVATVPHATGPLLAVEGMTAEYKSRAGTVTAAREIGFEIAAGECVALVGESGSGKTTIARTIAGLHTPTVGRLTFDGAPLASMAKQRTRDHRRRIQYIFQNPYESLNPRHRIGDAISWPARQLRGLGRADANAEAARLLDLVRLPARHITRFPSELSGGERQRVAIARALAAAPDLIICDEVTSALDVSVQAAVLELIRNVQTELALSVLFITHDLGVVATIADRVLVLNQGSVCEQGPTAQVLRSPTDPYTQRLIQAAPRLNTSGDASVPTGLSESADERAGLPPGVGLASG